MKKAAFFLSAMFFIFSCDSDSKGSSKQPADEKPETDTSHSIIKWQELISGNECAVQTPVNMLILDASQFDSLWSKAFSGDGQPEKPVVDFSKNSIVALFLGTVKSGGHRISVTSIQKEANDVIKIEGEHKMPGKSCIASTAIEFPFYIALTESSLKGTPGFSIKSKEYECE